MFYCIYFSNKTVYLASCKIVLKLVTRLEHDTRDIKSFSHQATVTPQRRISASKYIKQITDTNVNFRIQVVLLQPLAANIPF